MEATTAFANVLKYSADSLKKKMLLILVQLARGSEFALQLLAPGGSVFDKLQNLHKKQIPAHVQLAFEILFRVSLRLNFMPTIDEDLTQWFPSNQFRELTIKLQNALEHRLNSNQ